MGPDKLGIYLMRRLNYGLSSISFVHSGHPVHDGPSALLPQVNFLMTVSAKSETSSSRAILTGSCSYCHPLARFRRLARRRAGPVDHPVLEAELAQLDHG
jgi:hypothetical protein